MRSHDPAASSNELLVKYKEVQLATPLIGEAAYSKKSLSTRHAYEDQGRQSRRFQTSTLGARNRRAILWALDDSGDVPIHLSHRRGVLDTSVPNSTI